ncbi:CD109 antigen-like [Ranitomeya variabilis]|uniref:CD109 antigen-like n=1 Tax=Ranitomeya variabilis TaxID=490064 RepID=UPI004055BD29
MQMKNTSIFIQTDKARYKPGESVRIRVISVNPHLRPHTGDMDIIIKKDPQNIIVQQWLKVKPVLGIISKVFLLSDKVLLGDWKIQTLSNVSKNMNYPTSPKFNVILDIPTFYSDSKMLILTGTVTAKYISNTPVKGNVTISMKPLNILENSNDVTKTYELSGSTNFSFTQTELQNVVHREGMNVTVSVTEELTGIEVKTESYILNESSKYRLDLISLQPAFGPGLNVTAKVLVQRVDKKPLQEEERDETVTIMITQWRDSSDSSTTVRQYAISESGIIDVEFPVLQSILRMTINVEYQNVSEIFSSDLVYTSNPFIDIQIPNSSLKVGEEFNIQVTTHLKIMEIYYVVISRGLVVFTGRNSTNFSLIPEASWAPSAQLTVYWLNNSVNFGDIMQISKTLSIKGTLHNKVSLSWSKSTAHPLEHMHLSININEPHSLVGLRVIEKSSLLLGDGSDLTTNKIYDELMSYYQGPPASMTDAVIQNKYEYIPPSRQRSVLPLRHAEIPIPEVWIWQDNNISSGLTENLDVTVPDKNTSWVATAFVISERLGLGVVEEPMEISAVKPFLVSLNLPYSVTRGEQFILEVILSSSLSKNLEVLVSLELNDSFEIFVPRRIYMGSVASQHSVTVPSQGLTSVLFPIRPKKLGSIPITVKAMSNVVTDVVTRTVLVKAEGVKYSYSQTSVFELIGEGNTSKTMSNNISFTFPNDVVPGSEEVYITVTGDLLGPSINGLESLIEMPYGCGEQNMINFAPNIYILQYLIATNKINSDIKERAIGFMEQGYQKELTYKRFDGSFSAFGNADSSGSTWLSAFVFRCFLQARTFLYIDPTILNKTIEWMVQYQDPNTGIFSEPGRVIHMEIQGGQNGPITITAYILTALLEDQYYRNLYASRVQKAVQYLEKKFDEGIVSNYTLSIVAYAMSLANSSKAHDALTLLNSRAESDTTGTKFWSSPSEVSNNYWQPRTVDIETAAYALLCHYQLGRIEDGIPVMKWLSLQRNRFGGYSSTQDTIIALQALSKFLLLAPTHETSLTLVVTGPESYLSKVFHVNSENLPVLQSQQIKVFQPLLVNATAVGRGLATLQLNVIYNRKFLLRRRKITVPVPEAFRLDVTVKEETNNIHRLSVAVCMRFQGKGNESGMALLDVGYLSGFTLSPGGIIRLGSLKLVEPKEGNVYLYFDSVTKEELCISIPMVRSAKVANSQDAVVKVYDYYNPEMSASRTYNSLIMKRISTCDYCGPNCTMCMSNALTLPLSSQATLPTSGLLWFCIIVLCYFL